MDHVLQQWISKRSIPCWISTMTTCAKTNIQVTRDYINKFQHPDIQVRIHGNTKNRKSSFKSFANSVSCVVHTQGVKATIKLFFSNGTLHVTGCKTCDQALHMMSFFSTGLGPFQVHKDTFHIQLINIVCKYIQYETKGISLHHLFSIIKTAKQNGVEVSYDPDIYVGLKIKVPTKKRSLTILVFNRGCVILTGFRSEEELYVLGDYLQTLEKFMENASNENDVRL